jgi:hypothetical protein
MKQDKLLKIGEHLRISLETLIRNSGKDYKDVIVEFNVGRGAEYQELLYCYVEVPKDSTIEILGFMREIEKVFLNFRVTELNVIPNSRGIQFVIKELGKRSAYSIWLTF